MHKKKLITFIAGVSTISMSLLFVSLFMPKATKEQLHDIKVVKSENEIKSELKTEIEEVVEIDSKIEIIDKVEMVKVEVEEVKEANVVTTEVVEEIEVVEEVKSEPVFYLSEKERRIAECIVMGESGAEPYKGQILVAQCLLNACLKDDMQPSEVRKAYKYSGWNSNPTESVKMAVSEVFDNGYKVTNEPILYFYAPDLCDSKWHETQRFVIEVGGHRFFAKKSD